MSGQHPIRDEDLDLLGGSEPVAGGLHEETQPLQRTDRGMRRVEGHPRKRPSSPGRGSLGTVIGQREHMPSFLTLVQFPTLGTLFVQGKALLPKLFLALGFRNDPAAFSVHLFEDSVLR